ncbi:C5a anaphylatoxin chemotactic receptor 1-like [Syngnathoides biaculeatus]|uniref:C5a anaphylatoxin chemotactic receptor 1-like n=1 Tax=Syngnathoides biaculeatus TaxID=300417 RepID=UPI002ADDC2A4|nr:C5a anaphylatoxin chemotactic receptor 1-like [Syngnathoides biaculeatus]
MDLDHDLFEFSDILDLNYSIPDYEDIFPDTASPEIQPIQIVALTFYALVVLFGVPGNTVVVWVTGFKMSPSVTSIWFLNLALADLLCCLSVPLLMVLLAHGDLWNLGPTACPVVIGFFHTVMYCSILQLVFISLDRWLLVAKPVWCRDNRRPKHAVLGCVAVWCMALIGSIPEFVYTQELNLGDKISFCIKSFTMHGVWLITSFRFLLGFLLPFLVIVTCHWMVYRRVRDRKVTHTGGRSKRTLRVIVAVVLSFFLCWLPMHIVDFLILVTSWDSTLYQPLYLVSVLKLCLPYFNSCLNPLLYVCLGRGFKKTMNCYLCNILHLLSKDQVPRTHAINPQGLQKTDD